MSVIVRERGHSEVLLYSKGADSVIYRNLRLPPFDGGGSVFRESGFEDPDMVSLPSQKSNECEGGGGGGGGGDREVSGDKVSSGGGGLMGEVLMRDQTQSHLDDYAKIGLRTLCMAKRVSTEARCVE